MEQLKGKIPFLNKGATKSEDVAADADEPSAPAEQSSSDAPAWKVKLAQQLPFLAKFLGGAPASKPLTEDATDANIKVPVANTAEEKRKKIIRAVLVVGALYFAYDSLMVTEETPPQAVVEGKPAKGKKKLEREAKAKAAAAAAAGKTDAPADTAPAETPSVAVPATDVTPPVDAAPTDLIPNVPPDVPDSDASAPIEGTAGTIVPDVDPQAAQDAAVGSIDLGVPAEDPFATTPPTAAPEGEDVPANPDQVSEGGTGATDGDMTEQILKDLEKKIGADQATTKESESTSYIAPPDYENVGRGLVYNCLGKHWACIDGPSFKVCQQNHTALKAQTRPKECVPDSVYQSDSACSWVQKQKIIGNAKTDFCN